MSAKKRLAALTAKIEQAAERGVQRSAIFVADIQRQLVPVDTGALKSTIRVVKQTPLHYRVIAGDASVTQPDGSKPVIYAPFVEYGTANSPAQPFVTPSAQRINVGAEVAKEIAEALK